MSTYQYIFTLKELTKVFSNGKRCFENITLSFLPGVKIGLVGVNGAGKSTLLRIMAGVEKEFLGEAYPAKGIKVGYLPQEPVLDESLDVLGNVKLQSRGTAWPHRSPTCDDLIMPEPEEVSRSECMTILE